MFPSAWLLSDKKGILNFDIAAIIVSRDLMVLLKIISLCWSISYGLNLSTGFNLMLFKRVLFPASSVPRKRSFKVLDAALSSFFNSTFILLQRLLAVLSRSLPAQHILVDLKIMGMQYCVPHSDVGLDQQLDHFYILVFDRDPQCLIVQRTNAMDDYVVFGSWIC